MRKDGVMQTASRGVNLLTSTAQLDDDLLSLAGARAPASKLRALLHALEHGGAADDAIFQW